MNQSKTKCPDSAQVDGNLITVAWLARSRHYSLGWIPHSCIEDWNAMLDSTLRMLFASHATQIWRLSNINKIHHNRGIHWRWKFLSRGNQKAYAYAYRIFSPQGAIIPTTTFCLRRVKNTYLHRSFAFIWYLKLLHARLNICLLKLSRHKYNRQIALSHFALKGEWRCSNGAKSASTETARPAWFWRCPELHNNP